MLGGCLSQRMFMSPQTPNTNPYCTRLPGFDSQRLPRFFSSAKKKSLGSRWGDGICGALVQFGCYQHRY